ncbi:cytochrome c [Novosphingobium flavum]|jgi:cytochrome c556|uniref:c-type cytochrome n=1 Tax=Novosphingobium aerophilum TaxID=2839843 RepID=UPI001639506F|nr:cytochrome c [Novosphingobium aerophilum]MBC2660425.1 cytochrome c [Novosphingobium aerophilum]
MGFRGRCVAVLLAGGLATPLVGAAPDAIRARIETYRELGASFKAVNDGLRTDEVQTVLIGQAARHIRNVAQAQYGLFPPGSGPAPGLKTKARAEIWRQPARFKAAQDAFAGAAAGFQQAVASGNADTMRQAAKRLGETCKGCHDSFRTRDD